MRKIVLRVDRKHSALQNAEIVLDQGKQQMIFILLFTVLYLFRDLGGANLPDIAFTGLCAVAFILADIGTCLGMYIFTTALTVPNNEIIIAYMGIIFAKMFFSGIMRLNGRMLMLNLGVLFLQLLNMTMYSQDVVGTVFYDYITKMLPIIIPMTWYNDEYTAEDYRSALMCYVAGVLLGGTVTMILTAERITWEVLLKGTGGNRLGKTYNADGGMQTSYNANQLAVMFATVEAIIIQCLDQKRMSKLLGIPLLGYSLFLIILTRSRTALLVTGLAVVLYFFVMVVRRKRIFGGIAMLGVVGLMIFAVIKFFPGVVDAALGRFIDQEDITNGRTDIFAYYIAKWVETPWCFLFGYGIGSFFDELGTRVSPHNAVTDVLISWGLTGFFLVGAILIMCLKRGIKNINKNMRLIALLPAIVSMVSTLAGQYLTTKVPHMRVCFLLLAAKALEQEEKSKLTEK